MSRRFLSDLSVPLVSSLPTSPVDGQVIDFLADATNGVIWRLRYRAASASAYKWEFVGGSPLYALRTPPGNVTSGTYTDLTEAANQPTLTLPLAGDYDVQIGMDAGNTAVDQEVFMSYTIGGSGASDNDVCKFFGPTASGKRIGVSSRRRKTGLGAVVLTAKYRVGAGTGVVENRYIQATPVRVG